MPRKNKKSQKKLKCIAIAGLAIVLVGAVTFLVLAWKKNQADMITQRTVDATKANNTAEIYEDSEQGNGRDKGADIKAAMDAEEESRQEPTKNASGKIVANVLVTYAGESEGKIVAGAEVTNIASGGGKCQFTFTSGGKTQVVETAALPSAKTTPCEAASVSKTAIGSWTVKVKYLSDTAEGESDATTFEVQ